MPKTVPKSIVDHTGRESKATLSRHLVRQPQTTNKIVNLADIDEGQLDRALNHKTSSSKWIA
jgi:hypothetical protein